MNAYSYGKTGGDTVFLEIAKRLPNIRWQVVTSRLGKKLLTENGIRAEYYLISTENRFNHVIAIYLKRTLRAFFLDLKINKNSVLLGTSDYFPDVLPIAFLKMKNRPIRWVQHVFHVIPAKRVFPNLLQRFSFFFLRRAADMIIVDNHLLKQQLSVLGFDSNKIIVNHLGIDNGYLSSVPANGKIKYDAVYMAQLKPHKGILDLETIWNIVNQKIPSAKLAVVGKGNKNILKKIDNIELLGFLPDKKAVHTIKTARIFLCPSHEEGFGIAPLEAQAMGLPVVAWDLPVFAEVFPEGMIKIPMGNTKRFAEAVIRLLTDHDYYCQLSKEALANARRFSWKKTAERESKILCQNQK